VETVKTQRIKQKYGKMVKPYSNYIKGWGPMSEKKRAIKINLYVDKLGGYRWRCIASNGRQIAKCTRSYRSMAQLIDDIAFITSKSHDAYVYRDKRHDWRWKFCHLDGRVLAISGEGYCNRADCIDASDVFLDAEIIADGES
jgi:uncharacterized protein YegP (UPF0339 family)